MVGLAVFVNLRSTQGESLWLHLPIIKELAAMCHEVFVGGSVSYAYTTIPTYPRWVGLPGPVQAHSEVVRERALHHKHIAAFSLQCFCSSVAAHARRAQMSLRPAFPLGGRCDAQWWQLELLP